MAGERRHGVWCSYLWVLQRKRRWEWRMKKEEERRRKR
jgi:hypothetical protein